MADDLSLLLRIRGDAAGGLKATTDTRAAIAQLRQSSTTDLKSIQSVSTSSFGSVTQSLTQLTSGIPGVGKAFTGLSSSLETVVSTSGAASVGIASMAGPIGLAITGTALLVTGVVALHKALFDVAVNAADFRGKLFDLSQQTGVSVETLSALEILAKTTGSSIEQISASLGIFQKHLEDAQDPTSKQAKLLDELGVSVSNTEQTLRDTLVALAAMPRGYEQTSAALELFGRGGKSLLAILKETNGDLDGAIKRFRELGLIVSEEDAKAADEFNDQLALLQFQLRGLLGKEVIPAALDALQDLSRFLKDNEQDIQAVAQAMGILANVLSTSLKVSLAETGGLIRAANQPYVIYAETLERIVSSIRYLRGNISALSLLNPEGGARGVNLQPQNVGGGEVDTREHQELTEREIEQTAALKKAQQELRSESEKRIKFVQDLAQAQQPLRDQLAGVNVETHRYAVEQSILNGILKDGSAAEQEQARRIATKLDNLEKQLKLQSQLKDFLEKQAEQVRQAIEGDKGQIQIAEEFIASLEKEGAVLQESTKQLILRRAAILANTEALKMYQQTLEAIQVGGQATEGLDDDVISRAAGAAADAVAGAPPEGLRQTIDVFGELGAKLSEVFGLGKEGADVFGNVLAGAFGSLAQAVGSAVQAFVLFGGAGTGLKKFTATLISEIAKMAAVQAVWELAQGLAMLALNFFWPDPKLAASAAAHFHAAAVYGGLAAIAAVAGRAVAGNSFQQESSSGGSSGGSGSRGPQGQSNLQPQTMEANRVRYSTSQPITRELVFTLKGDAVVDKWVEDFDLNGRTRIKFLSEG